MAGNGTNQYTQASENKRHGEVRDAWRERVDIGSTLALLDEFASGAKEAKPSQIKAIEIKLDRFVPRLSAVEISEVNELDTLSREDILARIQLLLRSDPTLLTELVAIQARDAAALASESPVTQAKLVAK